MLSVSLVMYTPHIKVRRRTTDLILTKVSRQWRTNNPGSAGIPECWCQRNPNWITPAFPPPCEILSILNFRASNTHPLPSLSLPYPGHSSSPSYQLNAMVTFVTGPILYPSIIGTQHNTQPISTSNEQYTNTEQKCSLWVSVKTHTPGTR